MFRQQRWKKYSLKMHLFGIVHIFVFKSSFTKGQQWVLITIMCQRSNITTWYCHNNRPYEEACSLCPYSGSFKRFIIMKVWSIISILCYLLVFVNNAIFPKFFLKLESRGKGKGGVYSLISIVTMFLQLHNYLPWYPGLIHSNTISNPLWEHTEV